MVVHTQQQLRGMGGRGHIAVRGKQAIVNFIVIIRNMLLIGIFKINKECGIIIDIGHYCFACLDII